ncbi:MAG: FKBP-type peptidyl-prolyl cis-trans isomerase [Planctomycetaceae bacterium]
MRFERRLSFCGIMLTSLCGFGCTASSQQENADPPVSKAPSVNQPATGEKVTPPMPSTAGPVDTDAPEEFSKTESGLKYRIRRNSDGKKPTKANTVKVNYHGWTDNGKVFDSSYDRGEPIEFPLGGVIPGWTEGMQLVGEGGMIELEIPSELGYGPQGTPDGSIPPNATLHFLVELIEVK